MDPTPIVAVLAGGRSRRMGTAKALVPLGGRPLVLWVLDAAREAGLEAVVVAKAGSPLPAVPVPVWREPDAPVHPLAGVVAALEGAPGRAVIAAACDMPWVTAGLLRALAAAPGPGAAAAALGGVPQPFPARYPQAALPALRAGCTAGAPVRAVLAALEPAVIDPAPHGDPARQLAGINDPGELAAAEASLP